MLIPGAAQYMQYVPCWQRDHTAEYEVIETVRCPNCGLDLSELNEAQATTCPRCNQPVQTMMNQDSETPTLPKMRAIRFTDPTDAALPVNSDANDTSVNSGYPDIPEEPPVAQDIQEYHGLPELLVAQDSQEYHGLPEYHGSPELPEYQELPELPEYQDKQ